MLFIISMLLLIFPMELMTYTICSSNETILVSNSHFRLKNQNNIELFEQFKPFTYINVMNYELQDYNLTLIRRIQHQDKLLFLYQNNDSIFIRVCKLNFEIFNDTLTNHTFIIEMEVSIQPIGTLLNAYFYKHYLYLVYEDILDSIEYLIQIINYNTQIVLDQKRIRKQKNCIYDIEELYFHYFYFAQFNCSDWEVQLFSFDTFKEYRTIKFDYFQNILRQIQFYLTSQKLQITFDNNVYVYSPDIDFLEEIFVYQDRNILFYNQEFYILSTISKTEYQNVSHKAIIRKERPKKVLQYYTNLLFLFDSYIELFKNNDLSFNYTIQFDDVFIFKSILPYLLGVKNNQIILLRGNQMNPLFSCNENKAQIVLFYRDFNLKQLEWMFTMKKIEIKNEQILLFNIFENISQETIPILVQEIKQDQLEFEIFLDKFILGGPFDILDIQFNQNKIIPQENILSQICQSLDFSKIFWWIIFIYEKNIQWVLLFQDNNLFFNLINCDLQIKKKLFKLGKIDKSNIYQQNNLIIIQQNNKLLFLFELQMNLMYQFQQFEFKKDIIYIQPINGYFFVYFEDWELCMIHTINYNSKYSVLLFNNKLKTDIILYKQISSDVFVIATESQILLKSNNFQHIIEVSDFNNIVEGTSKEFVIIHKSKIQDQINIILKKYYLHNFQLIFMFELPKPNQSLQFIWPICMQENNQFLTIAAKEITTNHIFVLIYEISQSYSKILKEIIQVDCCGCLQLKKISVIFYQFENKIYKKSLEYIKFKVQMQSNQQYLIQSNNISMRLKSKINNRILEGVQIQLFTFSHIEGLILKQNQNLILNKFDTIVFDPREITYGYLQNITSSSVTITPALKLIAETILEEKQSNESYYPLYDYYKVIQKLNTTKVDGILCCQEEKNNNNISLLFLEENGNHTFIIKTEMDHYDIKIYNQDYILEYDIHIELGQCNNIQSIIEIDNYYFLICQYLIILYEVNSNQIQYISQINHQLIECNIEKVSNKPFLYLAYDKQSTYQQCILIEIFETNKIKTIIFNIDFEKKLNLLSESFFRIEFKNIEFNEDNYLNMIGFYFKENLYAQLFKLLIDSNQITRVIHSGIIRYPQNTKINKLLYINQFLVILFQRTTTYGFFVCIYDLHEIEQFEIFDSISLLEGIITDIMYQNNQSFILIERNQNFVIKKYQISQYIFEFNQQESKNYTIRLNNQLNSIEMTIKFQKDLNFNYYLKLEILFVNLFLILILLNRKKKRLNQQKNDKY